MPTLIPVCPNCHQEALGFTTANMIDYTMILEHNDLVRRASSATGRDIPGSITLGQTVAFVYCTECGHTVTAQVIWDRDSRIQYAENCAELSRLRAIAGEEVSGYDLELD